MTGRLLFVLALLVSSSASGTIAKTNGVTILTQRTDGATELYISARADVLFGLMGVTPATFVGHDDMVDFGTLRNGTFEAGDALLTRTPIQIGEVDAGFEAMSLMAHPLEDSLPMATPMEAMIAIGVCTGPPAGALTALSDLQAYVGYFADIDSVGSDITLHFDAADSGPYTFTIHEYDDDGHIRTYAQTLHDTNMLVLNSATDRNSSPLALLLGLIAGLIAAWPAFASANTDPQPLVGMT